MSVYSFLCVFSVFDSKINVDNDDDGDDRHDFNLNKCEVNSGSDGGAVLPPPGDTVNCCLLTTC